MAETSPSKRRKGTKKDKKGKSVKRESASTSSSTSSSSSSFTVRHLLLAIASLIAGILTPPLFAMRARQQLKLMHSEQGNNLHNDNGAHNVEGTNLLESITQSSSSSQQGQFKNTFVECNESNLSQFIHETYVTGMYILCFSKDKTQFSIYKGATNSSETVPLPSRLWEEGSAWEYTSAMLMDYLPASFSRREAPSQRIPWAIFSSTGQQLVDELDDNDSALELLTSYGMVIWMEGGMWLWPGVRVGFRRVIELEDDKTIELETLAIDPLVLSVKDFLGKDESRHVREVARPSMQYSAVTLMDKDKGKLSSDWRTSQSTFVRAKDDIMVALERRTASLTRLPKGNQEDLQVLRYEQTEKYSAHNDYFDPWLYQNDRSTLNLIQNGRRNRLATVFWYLSGE